MKDVEDEEEDEEEIAHDLDPEEGWFLYSDLRLRLLLTILRVNLEPSDDEEDEDEEDTPNPVTGDRNSSLNVGYKGDRSYVVRGNNIGVFNHSRDHSVKYYATIGNIATPKGKGFKPKNVS